MSELPRYIVIRRHPDLPDGFLPPEVEGRWYNLDQFWLNGDGTTFGVGSAVAVPTSKFERREDDGMTARVYEVRP